HRATAFLLTFPGVTRLAEKACSLLARPDVGHGPVGQTPRSFEPGVVRSRLPGLAIVALLVYVLVWNLTTLPDPPFRLSEPLRSVGYMLRLDQTWQMFAPSPLKDDGWYVIPGRLQNGEVVDLFRGGEGVRWEKPDSVADTYPNTRWRRYMMLLRNHRGYAPSYARYLCRSWNRTHGGGRSLRELEIVFVVERTLPDYRPSEPQKVSLLRRTCDQLQQRMPGPSSRSASSVG
ncbi:MAG: hypothetical protein ACREJG_12765, partial [Candidatus Rokuibacteriota bacterium]